MIPGKHVHFLGICGTGMAAAATLMKEKGWRVTGSDRGVYPPMTTHLEREGISYASDFDPSNLTPHPDLVVIGNALSRGNPELEEVLDQRIPYVSLPELLKEELIHGKRSLVVAGTHGKTTSTSLLAWVLEASGRDPSFFVGGIPRNFGRGIKWSKGREVVLEGDEYDTAFFDKRPKFLHYLPNMVIMNNIEFDHADMYPDLAGIERAFTYLQRLIPRNGLIVANMDDPVVRRVLDTAFCPVEWFGVAGDAPWKLDGLKIEGEGMAFTVQHRHRRLGPIHLPLMGEHNALNATGVYVACQWLGLTHQEIQEGFRTFRGVRRRMEAKGTFRGVTIIDDFAHHPTAIAKTLTGIQAHYPGRLVWAVFEPRSNTMRRNVLQGELGRAFQGASRAIIGPVYGEDRIDRRYRLDPVRLVRDIEREGLTKALHIPDVEAIVTFLCSHVRSGDIVVVMSSGGFGGLTDNLVGQLDKT